MHPCRLKELIPEEKKKYRPQTFERQCALKSVEIFSAKNDLFQKDLLYSCLSLCRLSFDTNRKQTV